MNPTNLSKREYSPKLPPPKRRKLSAENLYAKVVVNHDFSKMDNVIYLSQNLFQQIFPLSFREHYLKVSHLVYKAEVKEEIKEDYLEMNYFQSEDLKDCFSFDKFNQPTVQVERFDLSQRYRYANIKKISIALETKEDFFLKGRLSKVIKIDVKSLKDFFIQKFSSQFFLRDQRFLIDSPQGMFEATVEHLSCKNLEDVNHVFWGKIADDTKVHFKCITPEITLVQKIHDIDKNAKITKNYVKISKIVRTSKNPLNNDLETNANAWKDGLLPTPLSISFHTLTEEIRKGFEGRHVCIGDKSKIRINKDWTIVVSFKKATLQNNLNKKFEYKVSFPFDPDVHLIVERISDVIFTKSEDKAKKADTLEFQILNFEPYDYMEKNWMDVNKLKQAIRESYVSLPKNGKMTVVVDGKTVLLTLHDAFGSEKKIGKKNKDIKDIWALLPSTDIKINKVDYLTLKLIDDHRIHPLTKLKVRIERIKTGEKSDNKVLIANEEEIKEKFLNLLPKELYSKHKLKCTLFSGETLLFHLEDFHYPEKEELQYEHGLRFKCTEETEIAFEIKENTGMIFRNPKAESVLNLKERLIELGIGGLPKEAISFVKSIISSRGKFKELYKSSCQQPQRGALFYGPPGTGKTLLARKVGTLLGVAPENTNLITGSSIWKKYLGESEKGVRDLFVNARKDQEKYGEKSPLHLLIIDEVDSLFRKRTSDSKSWETSTLNAFLGELDGVNGRLNNMIVIGLTNQKELLDEAVLRGGRLGKHVYIGSPDAKGRKEILNIHTKTIIEQKLLDKEAYLNAVDKLVSLTTGQSGAFLEQLVQEAVNIAIERLDEDDENDPRKLEVFVKDLFLAFQMLNKKKDTAPKEYIEKVPLKLEELKDTLNKLGVVGLETSSITTLEDIFLSKISQNNTISNVQVPRGLFLCGSKRIGKTKLATALKDLYQIEDNHFHYQNISSLWQQHGQNLKKEIQKIFEPIYQAAKDLKEQSPPYLIVLDNIDYLFSNTILKSMDPHAFMDEFFCELDSLFKDMNKPNNMLVVFTSSYNRDLNPKTIKYGAQGYFIELKLPSLDKRREIFEYYIKPLHENEVCVEQIDIQRLALLTEQKNAEFIESVVSRACIYYLRDSTSKINTDMFIRAIQELDAEPQWAKNILC